jgi:hypothetical protein
LRTVVGHNAQSLSSMLAGATPFGLRTHCSLASQRHESRTLSLTRRYHCFTTMIAMIKRSVLH